MSIWRGLRHRLGHRVAGDGVEDHALDLGALLHRLAPGQRLQEVPGDRLALAVGVGGQDQLLVVLQRLGDGADVLGAVGGDLPLHRELVLGVDRAVLGRQVAHVAVGGEDGVAGAEVLVDGFRLGGRFDDDDGHGCSLAAPGAAPAAYMCPPGWLVNRPDRRQPGVRGHGSRADARAERRGRRDPRHVVATNPR